MKQRKIKAQNLIEYALILAMIAIAGYYFVANFDLNKIKNYVFDRPTYTDSKGYEKIKIEAMTE